MSDLEQVLACLHTDLESQLARVELEIGEMEQRAAAEHRQKQVEQKVERRSAQSAIFGVPTAKEKRMDQLRVNKVNYSFVMS